MGNILSIILLSATVLMPNNLEGFLDNGPGESRIIVAGDSYAVNFFLDEYEANGRFICCAEPGHTVSENKDLLLSAADRFGKYILLSIGVNDQDKNTHPAVFKNQLRDVLDKAKMRNKIVFMHSYENAPNAFIKGVKFQALDYDKVLRELATEYDNIVYIDMSDYTREKYFLEDGYHVNKEFNDILLERMLKIVSDIEKNGK